MSTLYEITKPLFVLWKYCGFISFSVESQNLTTYLKPYNFHLISSSLIQSIIYCAMVTVSYGILSDVSDSSTLLEFMGVTAYSIFELLYIFSCTIIHKLNNNHMLIIINDIINVESEMVSLEIKTNPTFTNMTIRFLLVFWIGYNICITYGLIRRYIQQIEYTWRALRYLAIAYSYFVDQIIFLQYATLILIARYLLNGLNSKMKALGTKYNNNFVQITNKDIQTVRKISKLYQELFRSLRSVNSIFSIVLLLQLGTQFLTTVLHIFNCFSVLNALLLSKEHSDSDYKFLSTMFIELSSLIVVEIVTLLIKTLLAELYLSEVIFCNMLNIIPMIIVFVLFLG